MVRRINTETPQRAWGVSADKMMKSWLAVDERKSSVYSTQFGSEDAVRAVDAVGECMAVRYEITASRSL
jgi:hypothetical protein